MTNTCGRVALSTTSVFPEPTSSGFALAADLGYDGVEVMVSGLDSASTNPDEWERLSHDHQVPVLAVHAPCLLVTQRTWGSDPWEKLERSAAAAHQVGADVVVVHPPFRWQRDYARGFVDGIRRLNETMGVHFCVENMYPWRTVGGEFKAYMPHWDPSALAYDWLTLDLSHAATAQQSSLDLVDVWGSRLKHLHLTDGQGSFKDEHLLPGQGNQQADAVLQKLAGRGWDGLTVVEVNTRGGGRERREADLAHSLEFARTHLSPDARP